MIDCVNPLRLPKNGQEFFVRCNHCLLCRLRKRADWTLRIQNEASMYKYNSFITLTYKPETVPSEINVRDFQLFMKRLRKEYKKSLRYFMSAEYGDNTARPHYHLILFGFDANNAGYIESAWDNGFITCAPLTSDRANYCCGYVQKKLDFVNNNDNVVSLYNMFPKITLDERCYYQYILKYVPDSISVLFNQFKLTDAEINKLITAKTITVERIPFCTMSRRPGLGYFWYQKNKDYISKHYFIAWQGKRVPIPLYYKKMLYEDFPDYKEKMMKFFEDFDIKEKQELLKSGFHFEDIEDEIYYNDLFFGEDIEKSIRVRDAISSYGYLSSAFEEDHKKKMQQKEIDLKKKNEIYKEKRSNKNYV